MIDVFKYSCLLGIFVFSPVLPAKDYLWRLPPGFPEPLVPADNSMSVAKVELGRYLFYEKRLSINGQYSCASCHVQKYGFADRQVTAVGATGERHQRNTMSLTNVAYNASYTWADPNLKTLEQQIHVPLFNESPVELGLRGREAEIIQLLSRDGNYEQMFTEAFTDEPGSMSIVNIIRSIASFVRTLISGDSAYDRLVYFDDQSALSEPAWRGMRLFFSNRLKCAKCHAGFNFSGPISFKGADSPQPVFHDNGLSEREDSGLYEVTEKVNDSGRFRAPTLRNIGLTAPYMHDGRFATLKEVIEHYANGGVSGPNKSLLITGFEISELEKKELVEFLLSLTDSNFVSSEAFAERSIKALGEGQR